MTQKFVLYLRQIEISQKCPSCQCLQGQNAEGLRFPFPLEMFMQRRLEAPQTVTHREDFSRDIFVKITAVAHPPNLRDIRELKQRRF